MEIETIAEPTPELIGVLNDRIDEHNIEVTGFDDGRWLTFVVREDATIIAGLHGHSWGGCAWVEVLWVAADRRAEGIGSGLLAAAETESRSRACVQIALSTHSFQARGFYERHGYEVTGYLPDYPRGHGQFTMRKVLG